MIHESYNEAKEDNWRIFSPKSERQNHFENDRYLVEARKHSEGKLVSRVYTYCNPSEDYSASMDEIPHTKKTLALLLCKRLKLDPQSVLDLQDQIRYRRPIGNVRTIYMCRSILLDRLKCDRCLAVPLVVGSIKAIRLQVISTVDQYRCLYRILKLAHESQNVYRNLRDVSSIS
ncbi:hypothetical protein RRG08_056908 [Elysia crispata]|uniref:Uncharacterized protein n=1 Tax=Elysia crispata TaxID=231223 RepID=A0AAE0Y8B0_9GAST|nr:hypothetical protein RRG08_056908 [Elysia crispata]